MWHTKIEAWILNEAGIEQPAGGCAQQPGVQGGAVELRCRLQLESQGRGGDRRVEAADVFGVRDGRAAAGQQPDLHPKRAACLSTAVSGSDGIADRRPAADAAQGTDMECRRARRSHPAGGRPASSTSKRTALNPPSARSSSASPGCAFRPAWTPGLAVWPPVVYRRSTPTWPG
jgi:hypothetical protein